MIRKLSVIEEGPDSRVDEEDDGRFHGLGRTLVAIRIALGLTQRQLAERLSVNESQVSRDERNEYQGVTVDRASRILDALGVTLRSAFQAPVRGGDSEAQRG